MQPVIFKQGSMRILSCQAGVSLLMGYIEGEGRNQGTLFPVVLDDFVPADHTCRVIDAFVEKLSEIIARLKAFVEYATPLVDEKGEAQVFYQDQKERLFQSEGKPISATCTFGYRDKRSKNL